MSLRVTSLAQVYKKQKTIVVKQNLNYLQIILSKPLK